MDCKTLMCKVFFQYMAIAGLLVFGHLPSDASSPWWSSEVVEEQRVIAEGILYNRYLLQTANQKPVRAHIVSVTGVGQNYLFGVLGSYGSLFTTSSFAKNSGAIAAINGGFFSIKPNRANGLIMAHGRILYPPKSPRKQACVGFTPNSVLFDWIAAEDIQNEHFSSAKNGWQQCYAALGAGPLLLKNQTNQIHNVSEYFNLTMRAPRTAIAKTIADTVFLVVVDGRQPDWSAGVTLEELAIYLLSKDVTDALNLDGGGSSTLIIHDKITNRPSDEAMPGVAGTERAIANVVALFKK
jgi:exopolysaccharide biosynthesis protein